MSESARHESAEPTFLWGFGGVIAVLVGMAVLGLVSAVASWMGIGVPVLSPTLSVATALAVCVAAAVIAYRRGNSEDAMDRLRRGAGGWADFRRALVETALVLIVLGAVLPVFGRWWAVILLATTLGYGARWWRERDKRGRRLPS